MRVISVPKALARGASGGESFSGPGPPVVFAGLNAGSTLWNISDAKELASDTAFDKSLKALSTCRDSLTAFAPASIIISLLFLLDGGRDLPHLLGSVTLHGLDCKGRDSPRSY